ncbi:MAG: diguanylate cyclase [Firmicutes bacterium]|nr:diguanylate cyclase [Bacillota bacterium]
MLLLIITAVTSSTIAAMAWRRRDVPGAKSLILVMLAVIGWALGNVLELGYTDLKTKVFWANIEYIGIVAVPLAWFAFAIQYAGQEKWLSRRNIALLLVIPALTLIFVWTDGRYGLMRHDFRLDTNGPFSVVAKSYGPWFWVHTAYSHILTLLGTVILMQAFFRLPRLYREQASVLLVGALVPWVGNVLYISGLSPIRRLDLTPCSFAFSGMLMAWGLFRLQLLDIVPMARDAVIEGMSDGVIVLDAQNRIVDINPAAQGIIGRRASEVVGKPADKAFSKHRDLVEYCIQNVKAQAEIFLGTGEAQRCYGLRISPLHDYRGNLTGRVFVLHEITMQKRAEAALRESKQKIERLCEMARQLAASETEEEVYQLTISAAENILGLSRCRLNIMEGNEMVTRAASPEFPSAASRGESATGWPAGEVRNQNKRMMSVRIGDFGVLEAAPPGSGVFTEDDMRLLDLLLGHATEALKRISLQNELRAQAIHDPLTGLYNRRHFSRVIREELERSERYRRPLTFMLIDVNFFKEINDQFGHQTGDIVLQKVGKLLQEQLRETDAVIRYGGDEFLIVLAGTKGQEDAEHIARRIRESVDRWNNDGSPVDLPVTLAIGMSSWDPSGDESVETALRKADQRMYEDKKRQGMGKLPSAL